MLVRYECVECLLFECAMLSSRGLNGSLYITIGRQEHIILLRHAVFRCPAPASAGVPQTAGTPGRDLQIPVSAFLFDHNG